MISYYSRVAVFLESGDGDDDEMMMGELRSGGCVCVVGFLGFWG